MKKQFSVNMKKQFCVVITFRTSICVYFRVSDRMPIPIHQSEKWLDLPISMISFNLERVAHLDYPPHVAPHGLILWAGEDAQCHD